MPSDRRIVPSTRGRQLFLLAVLVVSLATKLGWAAHLGEVPFSDKDQTEYEQAALAIEHGDGFQAAPQPDAEAAYLHPPGYPLVVAALYETFGEHRGVVIVFQALVATILVGGIYVFGRYLFNEAVGLVAAALLAIEPLQFTFAGQFLSESLDAALVFAAVACVFVLLRSTRPFRWAVAAGVVLAIGTYLRSTTFYLPLFIALILVVGLTRTAGWRRAVALAAAVAVPAIVLTAIWQVRNQSEVGSWRFSGNEGHNIYAYGGVNAEAISSRQDVDEVRDRFIDQFTRPPGESQGAFYDRMSTAGVDLIRQHPAAFMTGSIKGTFATATGVSFTFFDYLGIDRVPTWLDDGARALLVLAWLGAAVGFGWAWATQRRERVGHAVAALVVAYVVVSGGALGPAYSRMRAPAMPIIVLYLAAGIWWVAHRWRVRRSADEGRDCTAAPARP
jgi:4-amino-4-deoxy-L-arabinose transferase-like glycosyltransferase